ncbi:MAG: hypothetical protein SFY67_06430 [Candidatus Melainabacteria bacterium]|nr:hypothetical protein [Candidatus Melainabacteria bacterium]
MASKASAGTKGLMVLLFCVASLIALGARWFLYLRQLAIVRIVNGLSTELFDSLKVVMKRQGALLAVGFIVCLLIIGISIACGLTVVTSAFLFRKGSALAFVPIIIVYASFFSWLVAMCFVYTATFLVSCAAVCEKIPISQVISKGLSLSIRAFRRTLLGGFLITVAIVILGPPLYLPVIVFCAVDAFRIGYDAAGANIPLHWQILWSAWESIVDMVVWPVCFIFYGLYYADMKVRQEGQDMVDELAVLKVRYESESSPDAGIGSTA